MLRYALSAQISPMGVYIPPHPPTFTDYIPMFYDRPVYRFEIDPGPTGKLPKTGETRYTAQTCGYVRGIDFDALADKINNPEDKLHSKVEGNMIKPPSSQSAVKKLDKDVMNPTGGPDQLIRELKSSNVYGGEWRRGQNAVLVGFGERGPPVTYNSITEYTRKTGVSRNQFRGWDKKIGNTKKVNGMTLVIAPYDISNRVKDICTGDQERFHLPLWPPGKGGNFCFVGKSFSGKTAAMRAILKTYAEAKYFQYGLVISRTTLMTEELNVVPKIDIWDDWNATRFYAYIQRMYLHRKNHGILPPSFIILDDMIGLINMYDRRFISFLGTYRHLSITLFCAIQRYVGVSTIFRDQVSYGLVYNISGWDGMEGCCKSFHQKMPTKELCSVQSFQELLNQITSEPYWAYMFIADQKGADEAYCAFKADLVEDKFYAVQGRNPFNKPVEKTVKV